MACRQKLQAIVLCCAIEQNFRIEWHTVRADHLGSKGFDSPCAAWRSRAAWIAMGPRCAERGKGKMPAWSTRALPSSHHILFKKLYVSHFIELTGRQADDALGG